MERAFGRVDELDDPRPGHLSDGPTPISSTTTITTTLQDRFVRGEDQEQKEGQEQSEVPKDEDKETAVNAENTEEQNTDEKMGEEKTEGEDRKTGKEDKVTCSEGGEDKENQA